MPSPHRISVAAALLAALALGAVLVRLAWVGDDTYITLRAVENFVGGLGPVWNAGERVQVFTHPLWFLLLSAGRALYPDSYTVTITLSFVFAGLSAFLLARAAGWRGAALVFLLLLASRSFTDYAVSGLENPLSFALLALFVGRALRTAGDPERRLLELSLLASAIGLTRMDLLIPCTPVVLAALRQMPFPAWLRAVVLGGLPFLGWLAFSSFYYASPFPITAHAKAFATGVPSADLWMQGLRHAQYLVLHDPLTAIAIGAGAVYGAACRRPGALPVVVGLVLYLVYIAKIGGDFMGGRFFTPPFVVAVALLAHALGNLAPRRQLAFAGLVVVALLVPGRPAWTTAAGSEPMPEDVFHRIMDERAFYYRGYGLLSPYRQLPTAGGLSIGLRAMGRTEPVYTAWGMVGSFAFEGGDLQHVVDPWLLDPLLMRLPVGELDGWHAGHFVRSMPTGYFETLAFGTNRLHHPGLARYYDNLQLAIRGPLLARERLAAVWRLWTGELDEGLEDFVRDEYRTPPRIQLAAAELNTPLPQSSMGMGPQWFDEPRARVIYPGGLELLLDEPTTARALSVQVHPGIFMRYEFRLMSGDREVAVLRADARKVRSVHGMQTFELEIPSEAGAFDRILVDVPNHPSHMIAALGSAVLVP